MLNMTSVKPEGFIDTLKIWRFIYLFGGYGNLQYKLTESFIDSF